MKVKEILELDCRKEENKTLLQKALFHIPVVAKKCSKQEEVPMEVLEKVAGVIGRKYYIDIKYIVPLHIPNNCNMYRVMIANSALEIGNVYGSSLYEALAKAVVCMYYQVEQKRVLPRRTR